MIRPLYILSSIPSFIVRKVDGTEIKRHLVARKHIVLLSLSLDIFFRSFYDTDIYNNT